MGILKLNFLPTFGKKLSQVFRTLIIILVSCFPILGFGNTIVLDKLFTKTTVNTDLYSTSVKTYSFNIDSIVQLSSKHWKKVSPNGFKKPFDKNIWWLKFTLKCTKSGRYYLESQYPLIEDFTLYVKQKDKIYKLGNQGLKNPSSKQFASRYPIFNFHLTKNKNYTCYIRVNKTFATPNLPISIYESNEYLIHTRKDEIQYGIIYGIIGVLFFLGIITGISFKSKVHIYYTFYILSLFGILIISNGLFRTVLPANYLLEGYFSMYYFITVTFSSLWMILFELFEIKQNYPRLHKIIKIKILLSLVSILINQTAFFYWPNYPLILYKISNLVIVFYPIMMIGICFHTYKKNKSPKALYFLMLFMFTLIFTVFFSLLPLSLASYNQLMTFRWIIVFEGFTVLLILHRDLFSSKIQSVELEKKLLEEKQNSLTKYLQGLLNERSRISRQLHDSISSNLSALGRRMDSDNQTNQTNTIFYFTEIQKIQENVREISHDLHTFSLEKKSLDQAINDEIVRLENYFNSISFEITIQDDANRLNTIDKSRKEILYFTFLELIENALKHAKTNTVRIQLVTSKNEFILIVEDDGIGYDPNNISKNGIGLISIHERINSANGKFEIISLEKGMKHIFTLFDN